MRWIRSNVVEFTRLALLAMAVQAIATFGHVHLDGVRLASPRTAQSATGQTVVALDDAHGKDGKSQGTADFDCPICSLIQLVSTSAPAVAPPLPIPVAFGGTILEVPEVSAAAASPTLAFQARGPPAV